MQNVLFRIAALGFIFVLAACSGEKVESEKNSQNSSQNMSVHGGGKKTAPVGLEEIVKKKTLPEFSSDPIGKVLSNYRYFSKQDWKESRTSTGKFYIDCIGWFDTKKLDMMNIKNGVAMQGLQFKFVITHDGLFGLAMVSRVEAKTDGQLYFYPVEDAKVILEKVYSNKEITF